MACTLITVAFWATPAAADPEDLDGNASRWRGPGADLEDSRGLPVWVFDLYLDDGDATSPGQVIAAGLARLAWGIYRAIVATAIWLVDWVLSFDWLATLVSPVEDIADAIELIIARFGLTTTLLTITAFVAGIWMLKGAWSLGIYELVVSLALASLAVGVLSDPVDLVAGHDGYIVQSAQIGLQLSDGIVNGPDPPRAPPCAPGAPCPVSATPSGGDVSLADADELRAQQSQNLINVFIRMPQQAVNFGQIIDGTGCEDEYDAWMEAELADTDLDRGARIREFADCNPDASAVAESPDMGLVITAATITPGAVIILLFAVLIAGVTMWCAVWVLFQSVKAIIALVAALLPGNSRNTLWSTVAEVLVWLGLLIFSLVFLAVYLVVVADVMVAQQDVGTSAMFLIVDIVLLLGMIVFWRARGSVSKVADRLAKTLGTRPGRKPTVVQGVLQSSPPDPMADTLKKTTRLTKSGYGKVRDKLRSKPKSTAVPSNNVSAASVNPAYAASHPNHRARSRPEKRLHRREGVRRTAGPGAFEGRSPVSEREGVQAFRAARRATLTRRLTRAVRRG